MLLGSALAQPYTWLGHYYRLGYITLSAVAAYTQSLTRLS